MIKIPLIIYLIITMMQPVTASLLHRHKSPAMENSWSEIEMVYYRYFPDAGIHHYRSTGECTLLYKRIKKDTLKTPDALRCREHIKLLTPTSAINTWKQKYKKQQSYINLNNSKKAENHKNITTTAHIVSIKPVAVNSKKLLTGKGTNMVTGLFVQHAVNVRRYTFKDVTTGKKDTINATANHPFYVKNRSAFMPIEKVTSSDNLITETGQSVMLICSGNRKDHCGVAYGNDQPLPVYNVQIAHRHTYFVGENHRILVHNCTKTNKEVLAILREAGNTLPKPELISSQHEGNYFSVTICALLQGARHWYEIPDETIKESYQFYGSMGRQQSLYSARETLNKAGVKYQSFTKPRTVSNSGPVDSLVEKLADTDTELAIVSGNNSYLSHIYMVIRSEHSPTGYLALKRSPSFSGTKMEYEILRSHEDYQGFIKILPNPVISRS